MQKQPKQELIVTIGLPASGKTTYALELLAKYPDIVNLNRDDLRLMLQSRARYTKFTKFRENLVTTMMYHSAREALSANKSVIISDTNLSPQRNKQWQDMATEFGVQYREKLFTDIPLGVLLERDKKREYPVGTKAIMAMFNRYRDIYWPVPEFVDGLPTAYVFDVDGTLALMDGRSPFDWSKVGEDLPNETVIELAQALSDAGHKILVCSGRDGSVEQDTKLWLDRYHVPFDQFWIRPAGSNEKDYVIKERIYNDHIKGKYNVRGVFDDRDQVVFLWRHLGLTTMQVNYGSF